MSFKLKTNCEKCQKGARKHWNGKGSSASEILFFGWKHRIKKCLTISSRPLQSRPRTPNNVQLKWVSERKKISGKASREGRDNIETQAGKRDSEFVFRGKKRCITLQLTISKPYLPFLRTPNNVQREWASKRHQAMMKTPPSSDETEEGTTQVEMV